MPYFDYNATTPLHPAAKAAWNDAIETAWQNPSSPYQGAARAHALLEEARSRLAGLWGGKIAADDFVFTSGATESNNAVFAHFSRTAGPEENVVISAIEHPSVLEAAKLWFPGRVVLLTCDVQGRTAVDGLEGILKKSKVALVSVMAANNETGVLQPWSEIAGICRAQSVPFHCDATQWIGKEDAGALAECDYVIGSAHKFGGPKGVGFLKIAPGLAFAGQRGGAQEHDHRAGTENLPGILAMVAALEAVSGPMKAEGASRERARNEFETGLRKILPGVVIVGENAPRLWNTSMFLAPRHENTRWVAKLDRLGFEVSTGSACATGQEGPSHVLAAMGIPPEDARRAVRVSAGWNTQAGEWTGLLEAIAEAAKQLEANP